MPEILPSLLQVLETRNDEADDLDWNCFKAATLCLGLFAQTVGDEIVPPIVPYVENNIKHPDWHKREAAVMAFGSIIQGPDPAKLAGLVQAALPILIEMVNDPNDQVKDTTVWTIGEIVHVLPEEIDPERHLNPLLQALLHGLGGPNNFSRQCSSCIAALAQGNGQHIAPVFEVLSKTLLQITERFVA